MIWTSGDPIYWRMYAALGGDELIDGTGIKYIDRRLRMAVFFDIQRHISCGLTQALMCHILALRGQITTMAFVAYMSTPDLIVGWGIFFKKRFAIAMHGRLTSTSQWRHDECVGVSNHRRVDCLLNRLFRRRSKKTSKLHITGFVRGITGEFPPQRASNAGDVSIWWRHHEFTSGLCSHHPDYPPSCKNVLWYFLQ